MPIYEYHCSHCGFQKDHLQKLRDKPLTTCPACGQETYAKAVTAAGFQLKGTGWYATDFKGSNSAATAPAKKETPPPAPAANAGGCCGNCACHGA
ncbi:MAG: zinc ribbon domain-containing protein [Rhodocyclaceae bacterium]|nr:zinc ribbon domain-containing protein [Rhodocyclaceae bacterium]MBR4877422.1 zinc ribbon domain-containing protein [Rhodocyclaceae bacterium]